MEDFDLTPRTVFLAGQMRMCLDFLTEVADWLEHQTPPLNAEVRFSRQRCKLCIRYPDGQQVLLKFIYYPHDTQGYTGKLELYLFDYYRKSGQEIHRLREITEEFNFQTRMNHERSEVYYR